MTSHVILVVEDDCSLREAIGEALRLAGYTVLEASNGEAGLAALKQNNVAMIVTDIQMRPMDGQRFLEQVKETYPNLPVLVMTAFGTIEGAVRAMKAGALDYLPKPFKSKALLDRVSRTLEGQAPVADQNMIAMDPRSQELIKLARRVAASEVTVLITGESGTGKEVLARLIHEASPRTEGPFVAINCAAIPNNLLEATLFGYQKGAFTGAYKASPGKFEQAEGGTLLLDEISEMDLNLQAKLLRVLQEREVERLGSHETIALNVRVLATSNRDLRAAVNASQFREDLYYRLSVFPLHIAPLRERRKDILPLAQYLLKRLSLGGNRPIPILSPAAAQRLLDHTWEGNVRELDNLMQRATILQPGPVIEIDNLVFERSKPPGEIPQELGDDLKTQEQKLIIETLESVTGNRQAAANRLGISPRTLRYKLARMREAGMVIPGDKPAA